MNYSHEVERMCPLTKGPNHGPAPIPEEGKWVTVSYTHLDVYKRQAMYRLPYGINKKQYHNNRQQRHTPTVFAEKSGGVINGNI